MENDEDLKAVEKIKSIISIRTNKIIQLKTKIKVYDKETEKMEKAISAYQKSIVYMEKETKQMEEENEQLQKSMEIQKKSLQINEISLTNQMREKTRLEQMRKTNKENYEELVCKYEDEIEKYREMQETYSEPYKQYKAVELEVKQAQIQLLILETEQKNRKEIKKRFDNIQEQIFQKTIVRFAKFCLEQYKEQELDKRIKEAEKKSETLMQKYREMQKAVKEKELKERLEKKTKNDHFQKIQFSVNFNEPTPMNQQSNEKKKEIGESPNKNDFKKIEFLLNEKIPNLSQDKLESFPHQVKKFNKDTSKVRIINVEMVKPKINLKLSQSTENPKPDNNKMQKSLYFQETELSQNKAEMSFPETEKQILKKNISETVPKPQISSNLTDEKKIEEKLSQSNKHLEIIPEKTEEIKKNVRFAVTSPPIPKQASFQLPFNLFDIQASSQMSNISVNSEPEVYYPFMSPPRMQLTSPAESSEKENFNSEETAQANGFKFGQSFNFFNMF